MKIVSKGYLYIASKKTFEISCICNEEKGLEECDTHRAYMSEAQGNIVDNEANVLV